MPADILFRCDADEQIGVGHVMRCYALAEAARLDNKQIIVAYRAMPKSLRERFTAIGASLVSLSKRIPLDKELEALSPILSSADWRVFDGDQFDGEYFDNPFSNPARTAVFDDGERGRIDYASIVINPNLEASADHYRVRARPDAALAIGPSYFPLRTDFQKARAATRLDDDHSRILITMGGADPDDMTAPLASAIAKRCPNCEVTALIGPAFKDPNAVKTKIFYDAPSVHTLESVSDMSALLRDHDIVVTLCGGTLYEAAASSCAIIAIARGVAQRATLQSAFDRQMLANGFVEAEATPETVSRAVRALVASPGLRARASQTAHGVFDGRGARRCLSFIRSYALEEAV